MTETAFEYLSDDGYMTVSTSERKIINKMLRLIDDNKNVCTIVRMPGENDGYLYCKVPKNWLHVYAPKHRTLTEEQKKEAGERLARCRKGTVQA